VNSIGDQGPPNYCLHRVARMLRPALRDIIGAYRF